MKHRPWTPEEDAFLIACHGSLTAKKQAERLGRSYTCVVAKRMRLYRKGLIQKYKRKYLREWSQADIEYLQEHYASSNLEALQKRLKRSKVAIFLKKKRIGGILRADGSTYTAREIGRLFGRDTKWITALAEKGYIKGKRAPYRQGPYRPWAFTDADLLGKILPTGATGRR